MSKNILIIGGAGFIRSHLVDSLSENGHNIFIFDSLEEQVHGKINEPPEYLNKNIEFINGNVLNYDLLYSVIKNIEIFFLFISIATTFLAFSAILYDINPIEQPISKTFEFFSILSKNIDDISLFYVLGEYHRLVLLLIWKFFDRDNYEV